MRIRFCSSRLLEGDLGRSSRCFQKRFARPRFAVPGLSKSSSDSDSPSPFPEWAAKETEGSQAEMRPPHELGTTQRPERDFQTGRQSDREKGAQPSGASQTASSSPKGEAGPPSQTLLPASFTPNPRTAAPPAAAPSSPLPPEGPAGSRICSGCASPSRGSSLGHLRVGSSRWSRSCALG